MSLLSGHASKGSFRIQQEVAGSIKRTTGQYECTSVGGEEVAAFVPHPLPPVDPELSLDEGGLDLLRRAEEGLRRLELAAEMVPSLDWFVYGFVRKEAVVSSQIEGTQASLVDLLAHEASGESDAKTSPDVREICNYLDAIRFARAEQAKADGLPLSMRLLNEAHAKLMQGVRGANKLPGQVRRSQNWIGGTRPGNAAFVPPPPQRVQEALSALVDAGILIESSGRKRDRTFAYTGYLDLLRVGTEL